MYSGADTLVYAIGNSSRSDDGLGMAFYRQLEEWAPESIDFQFNYQLNIEDAELFSHYKNVLVVDATRDKHVRDFRVDILKPDQHPGFSTHALTPQAVLALTVGFFDSKPVARALAIRGHEWQLGDSLSEEARNNLKKALDWFCGEYLR